MGWGEEKKDDNPKEATLTPQKKVESMDITFTPIAEALQKRGYKMGIYGSPGVGKTHFCLTAPEPIYIIDTEMGAAPLSYAFQGKDIRVLDVCEIDKDTLERDDVMSYEKIKRAIDHIEQQENVGTVIIDSVSDVWTFVQAYAKVTIFKMSPTDRLKQQFDWGTVNNVYQKLIIRLLNMNCNVILTAKATEDYVAAGKPSGTFSPKWQKQTPYFVDFVIYNTRTVSKGEIAFFSDIEKCRPFGKLMGKTVQNLDWDKLIKEIDKVKDGGQK